LNIFSVSLSLKDFIMEMIITQYVNNVKR